MNAVQFFSLLAVMCGIAAALHAWAEYWRKAWVVAGSGLVSLGVALMSAGLYGWGS